MGMLVLLGLGIFTGVALLYGALNLAFKDEKKAGITTGLLVLAALAVLLLANRDRDGGASAGPQPAATLPLPPAGPTSGEMAASILADLDAMDLDADDLETFASSQASTGDATNTQQGGETTRDTGGTRTAAHSAGARGARGGAPTGQPALGGIAGQIGP